MTRLKIILQTIRDTELFGVELGKAVRPGDVICLDGALGAGKTTLTQFIAKGLGVPEKTYVTSPSFAIMHEYKGRLPLYHMDFYRLSDPDEVIDLGFEEYFYLDGLTVIEWPKRAGDLLPKERLDLIFSHGEQEQRIVDIHCHKKLGISDHPYYQKFCRLIFRVSRVHRSLGPHLEND